MLELGSSKHWSGALKLMTGESKVSVKSILRYFEPLIKWLEKENLNYPNDRPGF
jgi:hypothetical protein